MSFFEAPPGLFVKTSQNRSMRAADKFLQNCDVLGCSGLIQGNSAAELRRLKSTPEFSLKIGVCLTEEIVQWIYIGPRLTPRFQGLPCR